MKKFFAVLFVILTVLTLITWKLAPMAINHLKSNLISSFSQQTVEQKFISYVTQIKGVKRIQVATLEQREVVSQKNRKTIFWNKLSLPPVVVALEVPVTYTYYVDLDKKWTLSRNSGVIEVTAPPIEFNPPAADVSAMEFRIEKSSLFTDGQQYRDKMMGQLTGYLKQRAEAQKQLIKETARRQISALVSDWVKIQEGSDVLVSVKFSKETEESVID